LSRSLAYSLLDEIFNRIEDWVTSTPYWILIVIAVGLVVLFIVGLVKKFLVFTVLTAVVLLVFLAAWYFSGSPTSLG
jgi:membrane-bound ClpP family serine protease